MTITSTRVAVSPDRRPPADREGPRPRDPVGRRFSLVVVAVAALATAVSLVGASRVSMWADEAYTVSVADRSLPQLWQLVQRIDVVHGLYALLMHPWLAALGVSSLSVRLPSAIAVGIAAAGVVVLGRQLFGVGVAVLAGLVFTVLPRVTGVGIDGRSYALTMAVAVWMTVLLVSLLRRPTLGKHLGYAALGAVGISLNIFVALLLAAHGVALLLERRSRLTRLFWGWAGAALVAAAAALPLLVTAVGQRSQIGPSRYSPLEHVRAVLVNQWFLAETPSIYLSGGGMIGEGPRTQAWAYAAVLLAATCWLLVGVALLRSSAVLQQERTPSFRALLLPWVVVPTVLILGFALVATPLYNPRYLSFAAPAVALLVAAGVVALGRSRRHRRGLPVLAVTLVVLLAAPVYASQRTVYGKGADWSEVAAFVQAHPGPERAVYFAPRVPPAPGSEVYPTSRTAATLYPEAFEGVRDLTLLSTAAENGDLYDRSQPLANAGDRLAGVREVFVIARRDYPPEVLRADTAVLVRAGFTATETWTGPLNTVTDFRR